MVLKRIVTSLILGPGVIALLFFSKRNDFRWAVGLFLALFVGLAVGEFCELIQKTGLRMRQFPTALAAAVGFFVYAWFEGRYSVSISGGTLFFAVLFNLHSGGLRENFQTLLAVVLGLIYIPWLMHYFYLLFLAESGVVHAVNALLTVWGYDSGAFFIGKYFGRHPLAPEISPNKTVEGVAGGLAFAYLGASLSPIWYSYIHWVPHILLIAVLVGLATQLGDLVESLLKRIAGVKDSGSLFPGHGGVLDRIDGLIFALPVFYFYFHFILRFV